VELQTGSNIGNSAKIGSGTRRNIGNGATVIGGPHAAGAAPWNCRPANACQQALTQAHAARCMRIMGVLLSDSVTYDW
jgi:hypothetical protein